MLADRDARVAYVDTDYLSFCHPAPTDPAAVVAENLRAVWAVYRTRGANLMVVSGVVVTAENRAKLIGSIADAQFTFCRLTATAETIRQRILTRREAEATTQNSTLSQHARAELEEYGHRSVEFAEMLERSALEDFALSTDELTPRELAAIAVERFLATRRTPPNTR